MLGRVLLLSAALALTGCQRPGGDSSVRNAGGNKAAMSGVAFLKDPSPTRGSLSVALAQVSRPDPAAVLRTTIPVQAATDVLPEIQKVDGRPIVAVTEFQGWLWFATDVARNSETQAVGMFIAGYAVRKGGNVVVKWSVW
jgi:hypothetical protein